MSSARYTQVPTSNVYPARDADIELENAFESDSDVDDVDQEKAPLNPNQNPAALHIATTDGPTTQAQSTLPGSYDFEKEYEYDIPPPGSPTHPIAVGNTNGILPTFNIPPQAASRNRQTFLQRAINLLPVSAVNRYRRVQSSRAPGGNDGVFANVSAKPNQGRRVVDERTGNVHVVPEEVQKETPPSYADAQADSVPTYWDTVVVTNTPGGEGEDDEVLVGNLPAGSIMGFLWTVVVAVTFQFPGFILTYLLHTTHAAKMGSLAGFGITLIQYGLYEKAVATADGTFSWQTAEGSVDPTSAPIEPSVEPSIVDTNSTMSMMMDDAAASALPSTSAEWIMFCVMTFGWFLLLTSILGFIRVKRWEKHILRSRLANAERARSSSPATTPTTPTSPPARADGLPSADVLALQMLGHSQASAEAWLAAARRPSQTPEADLEAARDRFGPITDSQGRTMSLPHSLALQFLGHSRADADAEAARVYAARARAYEAAESETVPMVQAAPASRLASRFMMRR
ncbi:hypothetical protein SISSUDRAFT_1000236 [Sistotremastrum suecicum HHB10207 ss-3]|uniref:Metal homeostatis protein bsd2 n=1 Tax=Sistotremastrum suecicum HHB10207 ss-3 TaxID=1314776 RepID=A0A166GN45_9AGAM|nr:hypothetical protein SISSUDRAFT_1000236 [Sistotremastrum suecicum HHB10207 ss-3]